jgi:hypothetical protein
MSEIIHLSIEPVYDTFVSTGPAPDRSWRFTDRAGHAHRYDDGYPTMTEVVDRSEWCDGDTAYPHDPHDLVVESHWECSKCRERIKPGLVPAGRPQHVHAGWSGKVHAIRERMEWKATLSQEEADRIVKLHPDREAQLAAAAEIVDGWDPFEMHGRYLELSWV